MNTRLPLLALGLAALTLAPGCSSRDGNARVNELEADNQRLAAEISALSKENLTLADQRDKARAENQRLRAHLDSFERQLKDLGSGFSAKGFSSTGDGGVSLDQDFAFKKGSAELNDEAVKSIGQLAKLLNSSEYADTLVIIEGHTDTTPVVRAETKSRFGDNWGLSSMRAAAVAAALAKAGVKPERIRGSFRGEYAPRKDNKTAEGKAANRRVEIYLQLPAGG